MRWRAMVGALAVAGVAAGEPLPKGYRQAVPRGLIASIDSPRLVPASEARVPDDAWVLGVVVSGEARAYSLNILNHHEIVNDQAGDVPFAVVWCPLANAGVVYGRTYGRRVLRFEASGGLVNAALVMRDKETGSYWPILRGGAETGPLAGTRLEELLWGTKTRWRDWVRAHRGTRVLSVRGAEHVKDNVYDHYFASGQGFGNLSAADARLPTKEPVWAFERGDGRYAVPLRQVEGGAAVRVGGRALFLYRPPGSPVYLSTRAFDAAGRFVFREGAWTHEPSGAVFDPDVGAFSGGPAAVQPSPGLDTFWYVWSLTHPETEVLHPAS